MSSKESGEPKLQIHQIILLVAAVTGGVWLYQGPLKSSRPVQDMENKSTMEMGEERVQARLWQDPFEAIETHLKSEESKNNGRSAPGEKGHSHSLELVAEEVTKYTPTPTNIQILFLLTDGSSYADNRESRLRQRFAILAGLDRAGYISKDGEYIHFFHWDETDTCQSTSAEYQHTSPLWAQQLQSRAEAYSQALPIRFDNCRPSTAGYWRQAPVPVEWYQSAAGDNSHVLIFWIKDQDLGDQPLNNLHEIQAAAKRRFQSLHPFVTFKVIGPRFSGTLQAMIAEANRGNKTRIEIYSPWSTAPESFLTDEKKLIKDPFKESNVTFIRTIPTDAELADALVEELSRRGVTPRCTSPNECNHIAVISEWDTLYGRTLPKLFTPKYFDSKHLHQFSYLRGLDGELPHTKQKSDKDSPADNKNSSMKNSSMHLFREQHEVESMEAPDGRSQLDYLRRLAQVIKEKDDELRACGLWKWNCHGIKAIGVLGSDVYDKLLILQALKKSFPEVIFFTTDLDARLFHPTQLTWTRNLVVASHFDLKLNDELQGEIPPFRDTYQAATMVAILRALGKLKETTQCPGALQFIGPDQTHCFAKSAQIKLHEIGRNGPVDISMNTFTYERDLSPFLESISTMRSTPANPDDVLKISAYVGFFLLMTWLLLIPSSITISNLSAELLDGASPKRIATLFIGLACAIGLFATLILLHPYLTSDSYGGEPFSLFDGVSIWPSQILRVMVVALALLFLWRIYARSCQTCTEMEEHFCELKHKGQDNSITKSPEFLKSLFNCCRTIQDMASFLKGFATQLSRMSISTWARTEPSSAEETHAVWKQYRERLYLPCIIIRVGFWSLVFWVVGTIVLGLTGMPFTPFRGEVADHVNSLILRAAVLCLIGVIFLVLDITRLTSVFVAKLIPTDPKHLKQLGSYELRTRLQIIARLTGRIDTFIYYPTGLLILILAARSNYIDNWDLPVGLMIVIGLSASYIIVSAFQLRRASERTRHRVLDVLSDLKWTEPTIFFKNTAYKLRGGGEKEIQQAIDEVKGLTEGAFMPITELPAFRAVTLPTGFYAVLTLIETFAKN